MRSKILLFVLAASFLFLFGCNETESKADDAVSQNNPSLCRELKDEYDIKRCYALVADKTNDPEVCLQATDRNNCIAEFSSSKRSIKYCDMATDAVAKYACVAKVTGDNTGRAIEEIIADWRSSGAVSKCKELCKKPYEACNNKCYGDLNAERERCAGMGDYNRRAYCEYEADKVRDRCYLGCSDIKNDCEAGCIPEED